MTQPTELTNDTVDPELEAFRATLFPKVSLAKRVRRWLRNQWECRTKRCSYYDHYLAYGPADLTHEGFHAAERKADAHMKNCRNWGERECRVCSNWEKRLRA